ncbi:MAG TPA: fumarylacetoacetate hydrolase family protein [Rugosimonospora sp.]|nr:fumarylacetoacetate hydrolase family protein [Rugosimonospora sp.]
MRTEAGLQTQHLQGDQWLPHPQPLGGHAFTDAWQLARVDAQGQTTDQVLPFQPLSFRDFLLYEKHNVDAARGLVRRFHPGLARLTGGVERLSGRPFPAFRPKPLFYRQPIYYMSNHLTFVPSGTPVRFPAYSHALDFELELGFVLAEPLRDATPAQAESAIGAFVLVNDFSARDVQRAEMLSGLGPQKSKHFLSSMSSTASTADDVLPRVDRLTGAVQINGVTVSTVSSAGMRWTLGQALAHCSRSEQLLPGELFATGTLPGGSGMETGHWLRPGDTLTLTLDGIGEVHHAIIAS